MDDSQAAKYRFLKDVFFFGETNARAAVLSFQLLSAWLCLLGQVFAV